MISNTGRLPFGFIAPCRGTILECIIDEHDAMANKTMIADGNQFADKTVRLYFTSGTYHDAFLNFREGTYKTFFTDLTTIQVHRFHHFYIWSELNFHDGCL